ncbi:MAG: ADP-ribosylglycohydrolase family protein [Qingshengfaniella sp.]
MDPRLDRACGTLLGLALGDALGMPSQTLPRAEITARYGRITGLIDPFDGHPVSHGLIAGQVTDDTEQSFLLAKRLLADPPHFDEPAWARDLLDWEADIRARGVRDLLGPSTKAALDALLAGVPATETGRAGTTNGAAMRIAPVGIATPPRIPHLIDRVLLTCRVTHNTAEAIAGASAVAMVISRGIDGASFDDALDDALDAARAGQRQGHPVGAPDMAGRIARALDLAAAGDEAAIATQVGTSVASHHAVPAAFAVLRLANGDIWRAGLIAANIGDDTDTIGAIAGAMAGACGGTAPLPAPAVARLRKVNDLPIEDTAQALLALRDTGHTAGQTT